MLNSLLSELFKSLMPLLFKFLIYQTGKNVGKSEIEKKQLEKENEYWKKMNEKFIEMQKIDNKDYTNDSDNLIDRL